MNIVNDKVTEYLQDFYIPVSKELGDLRLDAEKERIPIIQRETETFLTAFLSILKPKRILEIGCAIGYSSMFMSYITGAAVDTIEKSPEMYEIANKNISDLGFNDKVHVYMGDGEDVIKSILTENHYKYDLCFIDAAKSHYKRFLEASLPLLNEDAIIISDNVLFKARVVSDDYDPNGKYKTNIKNLREFNDYVMHDERFISTIISVGDGLAITKIK